MTLAVSQPARKMPQPHRFTREEYYHMAEAGLFQNQRVELIAGEVIDMAPQKSSHFQTICNAVDALSKIFGDQFWVRAQGPLNLEQTSVPEPDVAVSVGNRKTYTDHPTTAILVLEVSDTTLQFDRNDKASLYANAGILDYWIVNIASQCVEVMRDPAPDNTAPFGASYKSIAVFKSPQSISPLANPAASIPIVDLLP
jgi:Uma2 family endonuclease